MTSKWSFAVLLLLVAGLLGCQYEPSDQDIDRFVDALMEHPKYQEYLESDDIADTMVNSLMNNPKYQEYLETTPEQDCAVIILSAAVATGDYTVPAYEDTDRLCAWYKAQVGE